MAFVHVTPLVDVQSLSELPGMLDDEVPWPRTAAEFEEKAAQLANRLGHMTATGSRSASELTGSERYMLGIRAASRWTSGEILRTPMTRAEQAMTGAGIRTELATAEAVMQSRGPGWEFATGVLTWLLWATGAQDELDFHDE